MKFTKLYKAALISAGISAGALYVVAPELLSSPHCAALDDITAQQQCMATQQQSWFSWFQGNSRSTQFHFVDLLELLSRLSPAQQP